MKKAAIVLLSVLMLIPGTKAFAQGKYGPDSANCIKYLSYYKEYFKQKNYDDALTNWRRAYKLCPPGSNQNMLMDGTTLIRRLAVKEQDAAVRAGLVDSLLALHDQRAKYFPKYAVTALNNKGVDVSNLLKEDAERTYGIYKEIITANRSATKPSILLFNMNNAIKLYEDKKISTEDVINNYQSSLELLENATAATEADKEQIKNVKTDIENLFISSKVATCQELVSLFTPRLDANPGDTNLVNNIVKMLALSDDCTGNDLFLKAVTAMYNNRPSASSAYYLYRLNASRDNWSNAYKYLEEAINAPDAKAEDAAGYQFELATIYLKNGQNAKAYTAAQKAVELDDSYTGKAYYLIGTIWGATKCGGGYIESRAPYWVAVDYLIKARNADSSLADDCNRLIGQYSSYFPQKAEAFMYDVNDGQGYTVSCGGMRASTTVRTQK